MDPLTANHNLAMNTVLALLGERDDSVGRDEPPQHETPPTPCGSHCADRDGALCGYCDAACDEYEERKRDEGRAMCNSAQQLYDHALIDTGIPGQSFARILAAVFRGEAVPAELVEKGRDDFAELVFDYLMRGGR